MQACEEYPRSLEEEHDLGEAAAETFDCGATLRNLLSPAGEGPESGVRAIVDAKPVRHRGRGFQHLRGSPRARQGAASLRLGCQPELLVIGG